MDDGAWMARGGRQVTTAMLVPVKCGHVWEMEKRLPALKQTYASHMASAILLYSAYLPSLFAFRRCKFMTRKAQL